MQAVTLEDKYLADSGRIYLSGIQALVRLMLVQKRRDRLAGLNTAGFVSGYRGSPLGGLDEALWKAEKHLAAHDVKFQPGVNEELAATAVWGTQQAGLVGRSRFDGVFALWYGKGPGVDRCGDVFKHMNFAGTARRGGVLLVAGDDHNAYSSTLPHQSDHLFAASMIPVLYPCNVQEYVELGLHGFAMSRFSGCAVAFKALADTVESSASIEAHIDAPRILLPEDFPLPPSGVHARLSTDTLGTQARNQEALMQDYKIYAAIAYARANRLNRITVDSPRARLGIVASGKAYMDVMEALEELGIDEQAAAHIGIRVFKVAMPWPLEPEGVRQFARGLEEILVVEEKRQVVEYQLKEHLYNWDPDVRPRVIGKFDERGEWNAGPGEWLLPAKGDFSIAQIARVLAGRIGRFHDSDAIRSRLALLESKSDQVQAATAVPARPAWYCAGCPHSRSTRVPEGSVALAGIGCHVMATAIFPGQNVTTTQMGGEGATWIGAAPFCERDHVFANLGDGTFFHSGHLALRAAVAAGVNITYKILYNDAVAMTGGQPVDGQVTVHGIARQVSAEGVKRIALVTEDLSRYADRSGLPAEVTLHARSELEAVQRELRGVKGCSVLIHDQVCAAEKRRRRKKGEFPAAPARAFINEAVCEGCGDCGVASNCTAVVPLETPVGRKRAIDQSACNQDLSCVQGFCPSFVTVEGATPRRAKAGKSALGELPALPQPGLPPLNHGTWNVLVTGIGGTGVITVGALMGMAAHLEGKGVSVLDMTGMSQKNGAVTSHVKLAASPEHLRAQRIATGEADVLLGCDMLTAGSADSVAKARPGRTAAIINSHEQPPGNFTREPDWQFPRGEIRSLLHEATGGNVRLVDATHLATRLLGDAIGANLFLLGFAWQHGLVPLTEAALLRAIELNGVAVEANKTAFLWGRHAAVDPARVERLAAPAQPVTVHFPESVDALVRRHATFLAEYQDAAWARRYTDFVARVREAESRLHRRDTLTRAVARNLAKLMSYKDEYEVARLYADPGFAQRLADTFEGAPKLRFHLAPPLLARRGADGRLQKASYGPWVMSAFKVLARFKRLRGTPFDPFGHTGERRGERALIARYQDSVGAALSALSERTLAAAVELASLPEHIRGFGHVKAAHLEKVLPRWDALETQLRQGGAAARESRAA
jgi:indolepyruvate ferredoxin oxidoreductase